MPAVLTPANEELTGETTEPAPATVAVRGDFETFYRAEWSAAARLAYLLLGSETRAEEVAQDAFIALHQRWHSIEHPSAYLRSAIVNRTRDRFRRKARWNEREHLLVTDAKRDQQLDAQRVESVEVLDAIHGLPSRQRAAIVLRYWGGLTESEIADALGVRPGTVKSLLHRALERLRNEEGIPS